jgi:ribosomal protein S18 acetylase RimI-like enzyme
MDSANEADEKEKVDDPMAGVPELKSYVTNDEEEKVAALKLVADSVAQMGQTANTSLIQHPVNLAILVAILSLTARFLVDRGSEPALVGSTCAGAIVIGLALCRYLTRGYIFAAEEINWDWLGTADVIVTKFGDEVIGTVIIDWVSTSDTRQKRKKAWRGEIKAWTVRLKYRKKGVGAALLDEAVKESRKKGAETIEFADEHASRWPFRIPDFASADFDVQTRPVSSPVYTIGSSMNESRERENCCGIFSNRALASGRESEEVAIDTCFHLSGLRTLSNFGTRSNATAQTQRVFLCSR